MKPPIFSIDFRNGSVISDQGNIGVPSLLKFVQSDIGSLLKGGIGYFNYPKEFLGNEPFSIEFACVPFKSFYPIYKRNVNQNSNYFSISFGALKADESLYVTLFKSSTNYIGIRAALRYGRMVHIVVTYNGNMKANGFKIYLNGILIAHTAHSDTLTDYNTGNTHPMVISGSWDGSQIYGSAYGKTALYKHYNDALTVSEAKDLYADFLAQRGLLKQKTSHYKLIENFGTCPVGSVPPNLLRKTGSYVVGELLTSETGLGLKKGQKVLKCANAGVCAFPSKMAYGTWEFDLYKTSVGLTTFINFIGDKVKGGVMTSGYQLLISDQVRLVRINSGSDNTVSNTPFGFIQPNKWYRIKITRKTGGIWMVWIKGGQHGNQFVRVPLNTSATLYFPYTENTYKSSSYFVIDAKANDLITNIKIKEEID